MTSSSPPQINARRVFGDLVVNEGRQTPTSLNSLAYTPSPTRSELDDVACRETPRPETIKCKRSDSCSSSLSSQSNKENFPKIRKNGSTSSKQQAAGMANVRRNKSATASRKKTATLSKDLVKKTQDTINSATMSVNASLNAARKAKTYSYRGRAKETAKLREQWKSEKQEALEFYAEAEKNRQELLALQKSLSTKFQKAKAIQASRERQVKRDEADKESMFKSMVFQQQQRTLKNQLEQKKRQSLEARARQRQNWRSGEEVLRLTQIHEDEALSDDRHAASQASIQKKQELADSRRQSFTFRSKHASQIRKIHERLELQRKATDQASTKLKLAGHRDAEAYTIKCMEDKRKSFELRNRQAREQREILNKDYQNELAHQQQSIQLKLSGERDADKHRKACDEEKRKSLAFRNAKEREWSELSHGMQMEKLNDGNESIRLELAGKRDVDASKQRELERKRQSLAARNRHAKQIASNQEIARQRTVEENAESIQLKLAAEEDAAAHRSRLDEEKRKSLQWRGKEHKRHTEVMAELRQLAQEQEADAYVAKWAGENDAKAYVSKLEQERRESLANRNLEGRRHRQLGLEEHKLEVTKAHTEEAISAANREDVLQTAKENASRDRKSLEFRRKEAAVQRLEAAEQAQVTMDENDNANRLENEAWRDVQDYVKDCKRRKRLSLAQRAREHRWHIVWEKQHRSTQHAQRREDTKLRGLDRRYQEEARRKERARVALDALQSAGCTFNVNPFAQLLN